MDPALLRKGQGHICGGVVMMSCSSVLSHVLLSKATLPKRKLQAQQNSATLLNGTAGGWGLILVCL